MPAKERSCFLPGMGMAATALMMGLSPCQGLLRGRHSFIQSGPEGERAGSRIKTADALACLSTFWNCFLSFSVRWP